MLSSGPVRIRTRRKKLESTHIFEKLKIKKFRLCSKFVLEEKLENLALIMTNKSRDAQTEFDMNKNFENLGVLAMFKNFVEKKRN